MLRFMIAAALTAVTLPALAQARTDQMTQARTYQMAQAPANLPPPAREAAPGMSAPIGEKPPVDEPAPNFEPIRPAQPEPVPAPALLPMVQSAPATVPAPVVPSAPASEPLPLAEAVATAQSAVPVWAVAVLILSGAFLAGLFGILTAGAQRRGELRTRCRSVSTTLATELETRRLAFESVPQPPNAEAGVSFVSSLTSLAGIDCGFRGAQFDIHLLPEKLASHVSVHYAAVQRVADFVKGQSLAAAVRMLQANRLGGHPCPDAGAMREAHVELAAAFRGIDKLIGALRGLS
jgi:hypothetical protein